MAETTKDTATPAIAADLDTSGPADIAPATEFTPAGAPIQPVDVDLLHPALDTNPRANTTVDMNRIDLNDPTKSGAELAAERMQDVKPKA